MSHIPQVTSQHATCVESGCCWLHYGCTDASLRELVAAWHRLAPRVRESILSLAADGLKGARFKDGRFRVTARRSSDRLRASAAQWC